LDSIALVKLGLLQRYNKNWNFRQSTDGKDSFSVSWLTEKQKKPE